MASNSFDQHIQNVLQKLRVEFVPEHWESLAAKLDLEQPAIEPSAEVTFDQALAAGLGNVVGTTESLWDRLENSLDTELPATGDTPSDENFDRLIKDKLDIVPVPMVGSQWDNFRDLLNQDDVLKNTPDPEHSFDGALAAKLTALTIDADPQWDLLSTKLDNQVVTDNINVDEVALASLYDLEVPYNAAHWNVMESALEAQALHRNSVIRIKLLETAALLLVLLGFFNLGIFNDSDLPYEKNTNNHIAIAESVDAPQPSADNEIATTTFTEEETSIQDEVRTSDLTRTSADATTSTGVVSENVNEEITRSSIPPTNVSGANKTTNSSIPSQYALAPVTNTDAEKQVATKESGDALSSERIPVATAVPSLTIDESLSPQEAKEDIAFTGILADDIPKNKWSWRLGTTAGYDLNRVFFPYDTTHDYDNYDYTYSGYSMGITLGAKYGKLEIETGLLYAHKNYTPVLKYKQIAGNPWLGILFEGLTEVQMNNLQVPLHLKYNPDNWKTWDLYASMGTTMNIIQEKHIDYHRYVTAPQLIGGGFNPPPVNRNYGWAEGGRLNENLYFTLDVGLSIEKHITDTWSIHFSPSYQHYISSKGIGPNNDKMNTISLHAGAKVRF